MAVYGGSLNAPGPQGWGFMATGLTQVATLAATSITLTLSQFIASAILPTQMLFTNMGGVANSNSVAFVNFGTGVTVSNTAGTPIVPVALMGPMGDGTDGAMQILTTGKSPTNVVVLGSTGTTTVFITPGEGSR